MKDSITIILLLFSSQLAWTSPRALLQSEDISSTEYEAFLKTEPQYMSAVDAIDSSRANRNVSAHKDLIATFETAERSFLADTVETAYSNYKKVFALAHVADWSEQERQIIFNSFMRAAQTAVSEKIRGELLEQAVQFDIRMWPNEKVFPPPLVAQWKVVKSQVLTTTLQLPLAFRHFSSALINGHRVDFKRFAIRVPQGNFRLTLLSNQFEPVTKIGTAKELARWNPKLTPMVSGRCQELQIHTLSLQEPAVLFADQCVSSGRSDQKALETANLTPRLFDAQARQPRLPPESESVFKKPLFWGIVGSVVAIAAYSASRSKSDQEPTHKTGF